MIEIYPDYIIDDQSKKKAVILPYNEWKKNLDEMEELDDIRAYDAAKLEDDEIIAFEQAVDEIRNGKVK